MTLFNYKSSNFLDRSEVFYLVSQFKFTIHTIQYPSIGSFYSILQIFHYTVIETCF